jgi:hypothetical protein
LILAFHQHRQEVYSVKQIKEVILQSNQGNSRRNLLKKGIVGVPVVTLLANKPAFGAVCTLSGFQSVNPSGVERHADECQGFSPGGWKENGYKLNGDGNRNQWIAAGFYPNPRLSTSYGYQGIQIQDPEGTLFFDAIAFQGAFTTCAVSSTETLHDVLLQNPGSLEFHVIANFLNAHYFGWGDGDGRMAAEDIVGVYFAYTNLDANYITVAGTSIDLNGFDLQAFLEQLYHSG